MEKKQYKDHYLPFAKSRLIETSRLLENILEPAGNYQKPLKEQKLSLKFFSKILGISQQTIGPTLSFEKSNQDYPLPLKWLPIINYLKERKIIQDIYFEPLYHDEPKIFRTKIVSSRDPKLTDGVQPRTGSYTHGDSLDLDEAISKVIGELLERFPLTIYREKDFLKASLNDLKKGNKDYLDINHLAGFSKKQKEKNAYFQFDENTNFLWTKGKSLLTKKNVLMPAQLVFWNYNFAHQSWREPLLRESNTNGASGHYTLTEAILAGIYELIQRDGFLIYWFNKQAPPQIDIKTIDCQPLKDLVVECQSLGLKIHFYNTTTEIGIPSCICTVLDHSNAGPKISMGGGCSLDWPKMLLRSLIEVLGVHHWLRDLKTERKEDYSYLDKTYQPFQSFSIKQATRLGLWANQKMFKHFQFFLKGKNESLEEVKKKFPQFSSPEEELNYLIKKFKSLGQGYEISYYQAEHQALKDLGYFSVKVIIPTLVTLYLNEPYAVLGAKRLKEVPRKLGFRPAKKWNYWPHPFP